MYALQDLTSGAVLIRGTQFEVMETLADELFWGRDRMDYRVITPAEMGA